MRWLLELDGVEVIVIDPHREGIRLHKAVFGLDQIQVMAIPQNALYAAEEMAHVSVGMEADQIRAQQPVQYVFAPDQLAENLIGRERNVQEKAHLRIRVRVFDQLWQKHQLIIVNPNNIARLDHRFDGLEELLVHRLVGFPGSGVVLGLFTEIVKQRPYRFVGEAVVVQLVILP